MVIYEFRAARSAAGVDRVVQRVSYAKTMLAMITVEAKAAFEAAQNLAAVYRPPGAA